MNLRRRTHGTGHHELLDWPFQVEQPVAPAVAAWADAVDWLADGPDLAAARLVLAPGVRQETTGAPGAADPEVIVLRQDRGLRRARRVGTVAAALVGACDGELTVGAILDAVSDLLGRDPTATRQDMRPVVAELVREGYLLSPAAPR